MTGWKEETPSLAWPVFIAGLAFGLRVVLLGEHAFHMDEALYATFSRRILHGDLLLTGGLNNDKPPLQFYWGAIGLGLFGEKESSLRLMSVIASSLECGVLTWMLLPLCGGLAAAGAGLLLASSPLHRAFGATAVMDPLFSLLLLMSLAAAIRKQAGLAGFAWGLALASKQTALFFLPFPFLASLWSADEKKEAFKHWCLGSAFVLVPLFLWAAIFSHPRLGMVFGMASNQPEVGITALGSLERSGRWLRETGRLLSLGALTQLFFICGPLLGLALILKGKKAWALAAFLPIFGIGLFSALNMRFFDRYYIPLVWALAALPALVLLLFHGQRIRKALAYAVLALGVLAWFQGRTLLPWPEQQGALGSVNDGERVLFEKMNLLETEGASAASDQGGLRWMGAWYLKGDWALSDSADLAAVHELQSARPRGGLYLISKEAQPTPIGWHWRLIAKEDSWVLYKALQ